MEVTEIWGMIRQIQKYNSIPVLISEERPIIIIIMKKQLSQVFVKVHSNSNISNEIRWREHYLKDNPDVQWLYIGN